MRREARTGASRQDAFRARAVVARTEQVFRQYATASAASACFPRTVACGISPRRIAEAVREMI